MSDGYMDQKALDELSAAGDAAAKDLAKHVTAPDAMPLSEGELADLVNQPTARAVTNARWLATLTQAA